MLVVSKTSRFNTFHHHIENKHLLFSILYLTGFIFSTTSTNLAKPCIAKKLRLQWNNNFIRCSKELIVKSPKDGGLSIIIRTSYISLLIFKIYSLPGSELIPAPDKSNVEGITSNPFRTVIG
jgi:hypothetical protein